MHLEEIDDLFRQERFETVRRVCHAALNNGVVSTPQRNQLYWRLHRAHRNLCDLYAAGVALESIQPGDDDEAFAVMLCKAEDFYRRAGEGFYRTSDEARRGLVFEEYQQKWWADSAALLNAATKLADSPARRQRVAESLTRCQQKEAAAALVAEDERALEKPKLPKRQEAADTGSSISGRLRFADGKPVRESLVTLGFDCPLEVAEPSTFMTTDSMGYRPKLGPQKVLTAKTLSDGSFAFNQLPAGQYAFIAVTLDPAKYDVSTRFIAQNIKLTKGERSHFDLTVQDWHSAPADHAPSPMPTELIRSGVRYRLIHQEPLRNAFHYCFPRQLIGFKLPAEAAVDRLMLIGSAVPDESEVFQVCGDRVVFFTDLPATSEKWFGLYLV